MRLDLQELRVEDDFLTGGGRALVIVLRRNAVHVYGAEHRYDGHVAGHDRFGCNLSFRTLNDPFLEYLALNERVLRHNADGLAFGPEILGKGFPDSSVVVEHDEVDSAQLVELGREREVRRDFFATGILRLAREPADELLALDRWVGRKLERVTGITGVGLVHGFAVELVGNGEGVLLVRSPNLEVRAGRNGVVEIAAGVNPLAGVARLGGNGRHVVDAIIGVDVNGSGGQCRRSVFALVERDGVIDLLVIGHDDRIGCGYIACVDAGTGDFDFIALTALDNLTDRPVGGVAFAFDGGRELVADGLAFRDLYRFLHIGVVVVEGDRPGFLCAVGLGGRVVFAHGALAGSRRIGRFQGTARCAHARVLRGKCGGHHAGIPHHERQDEGHEHCHDLAFRGFRPPHYAIQRSLEHALPTFCRRPRVAGKTGRSPNRPTKSR